MSLSDTARLFAAVHAAQTDSLIQCWRLKRDVGFWRPIQAIRDADLDGNPATTPRTRTWTPLIPNPPYSDYVSGHGCAHQRGGRGDPPDPRRAHPAVADPSHLAVPGATSG